MDNAFDLVRFASNDVTSSPVIPYLHKTTLLKRSDVCNPSQGVFLERTPPLCLLPSLPTTSTLHLFGNNTVVLASVTPADNKKFDLLFQESKQPSF